MASERRSQFPFIKRGHSVRTVKEKKPREEEGALSRWLRDLRGGGPPSSQESNKNIDRSNPIYHSEGKGPRQKKHSSKDNKRRHSFNQRPQAINRCCSIREDGAGRSSLEAFAMTGGTGKSSAQYIISTSPLDHCRTGGSKGHEKGASWGGEDSQPVRQHRANSFTQQLKTVMERCEKMPPGDKFLPKVDREGKILGDSDYSIPSPPERDISQLDHFSKFNETRLSQLSIDGGYDGSQTSLTRAELEQYSRAYEDVRPPSHSQQPSYAQSEGYHSYVSSADSTTTTPFLDRLRRDNIETSSGLGGGGGRESSASSGSSSETLKWHGSISDVSSTGHTLDIAHSARVPMPQRHHSESILYLEPWSQQNNNSQMRRLFPVTTYEPTSPRQLIESYTSSSSRSPPKLSVAERICEIERQNGSRSQHHHGGTGSDSESKTRNGGSSRALSSATPTDHATLKAMQKKALLSFYERHHSAWKSEPQLTAPSIPPQPPPRQLPPPPTAAPVPPSSRRSSSASDYAGASVRREIPKSHLDLSKPESNGMRDSKHQYSSSCGSLATAALGPVILGPAISVDDWVPARPPKKPHLRAAYPLPPPRPNSPPPPRSSSSGRAAYPLPPRPTSPDLPPPSPPPILEGELHYSDEPLPPPPPEVQLHSSLPNKDKARYDRAMNASMSLDNLTRSELKPSFHHSKSQENSRVHDIYYENGSELKRTNSHENSIKNGLMDKFNERYVENRIESMQTIHCDPVPEIWEKNACYLDMRRFSSEKKTSLESQPRASLLSPPLAPKGKRPHVSTDQPRSLDSNLSIIETDIEVNMPGPQTPLNKKYAQEKMNYSKMKESFSRSTSVQNERLVKNTIERQSLRYSTPAHNKLNLNGKLVVNNGRISPPSRKANLVRTPSDVTRRVSYSHGIHHAKPLGKQHVALKQMCTDIHSQLASEPIALNKSCLEFPTAAASSPRHYESDAFVFGPGKQQQLSSSSTGMEHPGGPISPPALLPHCPPTTLQLSQSKASYLAYRREPKDKEKGLPNFQGSYKRTMSPTGARIINNSVEKIEDFEIKNGSLEETVSNGLLKTEEKTSSHETDDSSITSSPPGNVNNNNNCANNNFDSKEPLSKTLPRNLNSTATGTAVTPVKRNSRPPRAQSDPTSSAKLEKKSVLVSASTQDNLDEERRTEDGKPCPILVGRSQSDRTGEARKEERARGMSDAASQTTPAPSPPPSSTITTTVVPHRRPLQEEVECEQLSRDLASQLSPSHKLHGILVPGPEVKRTTDYVSGLFRMDFTPRTRSSISSLPTSATSTNTEIDDSSQNSSPSDSIRLHKCTLVENNGTSSMSSLQQKKQELMHRLSKKLSVLRAESVAVNEEISLNEALGVTVTERVEKVARPQEFAKFRLHVKEVGHITSLLLSLSGRLARAENALLTLTVSHQERKSYEDKRDKLLGQLNEAKQLKSNIDQRSGNVSSMLYNYLTGEEYTDYDHFINMKSKLLVDSREIAEKIQLGEEQLAALKETLDQVR